VANITLHFSEQRKNYRVALYGHETFLTDVELE